MVGKNKRKHPDVEELLARPWCYYCERDFDDLKILISHQKAKHFKCERCGRRLNTAGGLSVHMNQVHKETLASVENSIPNRAGLEVEIFGMEGIPEEVASAHNHRIIDTFYRAEAERRAATGNPGPGTNSGAQAKKPKLESPADLKKRLAEHKARKAEQAVVGTSGGNTPMGGLDGASPMAGSPGAFAGSPFAPAPSAYGAPPGAGYNAFPQEPYSQAPVAYQQAPYNPPASFSGAPGQSYQPQYSPPTQYPAQTSYAPGSYPPPQSYASPPPPGPFGGYQQPPSHTPPAPLGLPNRPPGLPAPPGLPQRPSFVPPAIPSHQMQQLHQPYNGNVWNGNGNDQNAATSSNYSSHGYNGGTSTNHADDTNAGAKVHDSIDEMIARTIAAADAKALNKPAPAIEPAAGSLTPNLVPAAQIYALPPKVVEPEVKPETTEKKPKKEKPLKMVYSDNEVSIEEKMAMLPRYAFVPDANTELVPEEASAVTGIAGTVDGA